MTFRKEITCIVKPDPQSPHERILRVGGAGFDFSLPEAVAMASRGDWQFFVKGPGLIGMEVDVFVNDTRPGVAPFLQTRSDGIWSNNLLSLPQCTSGLLS